MPEMQSVAEHPPRDPNIFLRWHATNENWALPNGDRVYVPRETWEKYINWTIGTLSPANRT